MSDLCRSLEDEHRVIERVLESLESEVVKLERGDAVRGDYFADAIAFVREFADGVHHQKEEKVLFPRMAAAGIPTEGGPIGVMLHEHELGRALIAKMESALDGAVTGDETARRHLIEATTGYVDLLRGHIQKEDGILFPMADDVFDLTQKTEIRTEFAVAETTDAAVTAKRQAWSESLKNTDSR